MTPQKLKISILQSAVQGKLVEHSDKSLSDDIINLRKKINYSKKKMEQITLETDYPYDIPDSWVWVRLGEVAEVIRGLTFSKSNKEPSKGNILVLRGGNIDSQTEKLIFDDNIYVDESIPKEEQYLIEGDCLIVASSGTKSSVGKSCYVENIPPKTSFGGFMMVVRAGVYVNPKIISYHIKLYRQKIINDTAGYISNITNPILNNLLIPLPPLEEQHRIVSKIEELLPFVDRYAKAYEKLEMLNAKFPEDMKKSILQYAIQGKLVEQRPEEGTAEELYQQIQDEKQRLVKEGKIKKSKSLAEITEDEIPFDIPESWKWDRLGNLLVIERGGSPRPIKDFITTDDNGINWIKIGDTEKGSKYINSCAEKIIPEGMKKSRYVEKGDFILSNSMSFGRPYILNIDGCIHDGWLVLRQPVQVFDNDYLYYLLSSPMVFYQFCGRVAGAVVNNLNSDKVALTVVPIPPIDEQKRIAKKIEEMLPYCDKLIK